MARDRLTLWNGELCYIVGDAIVELPQNDKESLYVVIVAVNKVECNSPKSIIRAVWIPKSETTQLISDMDYSLSEWFVGLERGLQNED